MRISKIHFKGEDAGLLKQLDDGTFVFEYDKNWLNDSSKPAISLNFQKTKPEFKSDYLFPFFFNMLPEGINKLKICKFHRIDEDDYFGILTHAAKYDSIGAITVTIIENL